MSRRALGRAVATVEPPSRRGRTTERPDAVVVRLLSFTARVTSDCPALLRDIASLYPTASVGPGRSAGLPTVWFRVTETSVGRRGRRLTVRASDGQGGSFGSADQALAYLAYQIDAAAAVGLARYLLIHSGAVAHGGSAILMPGASGAGKSTLVAALALAGFRYLSDELAVVDGAASAALPFLKPLCLKAGGWTTLQAAFDTRQSPLNAVRPDGEQVFYLVPPRPCALERRLPIRSILMPVRRTGADAVLAPISRAQTLAELARHSLNLPRHGPAAIEALARVVEGAACYTLTYEDLPAAVATVSTLVGRRQPVRRSLSRQLRSTTDVSRA
jgi:HprK-related kinase A